MWASGDRSPWTRLPNSVLASCFSWLASRDWSVVSQTCTRAARVAQLPLAVPSQIEWRWHVPKRIRVTAMPKRSKKPSDEPPLDAAGGDATGHPTRTECGSHDGDKGGGGGGGGSEDGHETEGASGAFVAKKGDETKRGKRCQRPGRRIVKRRDRGGRGCGSGGKRSTSSTKPTKGSESGKREASEKKEEKEEKKQETKNEKGWREDVTWPSILRQHPRALILPSISAERAKDRNYRLDVIRQWSSSGHLDQLDSFSAEVSWTAHAHLRAILRAFSTPTSKAPLRQMNLGYIIETALAKRDLDRIVRFSRLAVLRLDVNVALCQWVGLIRRLPSLAECRVRLRMIHPDIENDPSELENAWKAAKSECVSTGEAVGVGGAREWSTSLTRLECTIDNPLIMVGIRDRLPALETLHLTPGREMYGDRSEWMYMLGNWEPMRMPLFHRLTNTSPGPWKALRHLYLDNFHMSLRSTDADTKSEDSAPGPEPDPDRDFDIDMCLLAPHLETICITLSPESGEEEGDEDDDDERCHVIDYAFFSQLTSLRRLTINDTGLRETKNTVQILHPDALQHLPSLEEVTTQPVRESFLPGRPAATASAMRVTTLRLLAVDRKVFYSRIAERYPSVRDLYVPSFEAWQTYAEFPRVERIHIAWPGHVHVGILREFGQLLLERRQRCPSGSVVSPVATSAMSVMVQWDGWSVDAMACALGRASLTPC
jgi:hypothetical protein